MLSSTPRSALISHDELWAAVDRRVAAAQFFLSEMSKDLVPPQEKTGEDGSLLKAIRTTGVTVNHPWEDRFYPHFNAFLAMTRSVPEIVNCLFGFDRKVIGVDWGNGFQS
jgi:hypothetical protein